MTEKHAMSHEEKEQQKYEFKIFYIYRCMAALSCYIYIIYIMHIKIGLKHWKKY